jgi:cytochrome d ubiquinol oxidase subunit II
VLAGAFSGYYLALFLILWLLILRGMALEVGGHLADGLWQTFWDVVFALSSVLLAVLLGAALGNLLRGVPLDAGGQFHMAFFTDFGVRGEVGLLDWYTISLGVFALVTLSAHGATYLAYKTSGGVHERTIALARRLWVAVFAGLVVVSVETWYVRPDLLAGLARRPLAWLAGAGAVAGAITLVAGLRGRRDLQAFAGSCLLIAGLLSGAAAAVFPVLLYSTLDAEHSLTAYNSSANSHSLALALLWWPIALVLALGYFGFIAHHYRGKVEPSQDMQGFS